MTNKRQEALRRFLNEHPEFAGQDAQDIIDTLDEKERNSTLAKRLSSYKPVNSIEMDEGCFYINPKPACP